MGIRLLRHGSRCSRSARVLGARKETRLQMTLPSFLCIGAQKAGTTWLHAQLRSHPNVWMPPIKELHYFDYKFVKSQKVARKFVNSQAHNRIENERKKIFPNEDLIQYFTALVDGDMSSEGWYRHAFCRPGAEGKLTGEITPAYCIIPEAGIECVRSLLGPVKIIYLIRDPIGRMISGLKMIAARKSGPPKTEMEWRDLASRKVILNRGDYSACIPRWKKFFSEDEILFLPFKRVAQDPLGLLQDVEDFLGIERHKYRRATDKIHVSKHIEIPDVILESLGREAARQREYLIREFDENFVRLI